jgi:hypothetical protein
MRSRRSTGAAVKSYFMLECGCFVNGGDTSNITTQPGDSGGPV